MNKTRRTKKKQNKKKPFIWILGSVKLVYWQIGKHSKTALPPIEINSSLVNTPQKHFIIAGYECICFKIMGYNSVLFVVLNSEIDLENFGNFFETLISFRVILLKQDV